MDAPLCRTCGLKHWSTEPCGGLVHAKPTAEGRPGVWREAKPPANPAEKFDRVAYQREYMRKRRAAEKAKR